MFRKVRSVALQKHPLLAPEVAERNVGAGGARQIEVGRPRTDVHRCGDIGWRGQYADQEHDRTPREPFLPEGLHRPTPCPGRHLRDEQAGIRGPAAFLREIDGTVIPRAGVVKRVVTMCAAP